MLARVGIRVSAIIQGWIPDPFVIAVGLTWVIFWLALLFGGFPSADPTMDPSLILLDAWRDDSAGLWKLLAFGMQMCLVLVTGYALASAPPVTRLLRRIADLPSSTASAAASVAAVACVTGLLNWGLGLVCGAFMAREAGCSLQRRGEPVHYPLIVAAGYTGMLVWHGGLSGSAPLSMTTVSGIRKVLPAEMSARIEPLALTETVFSPLNFVVTGGLLIVIPLVVYLLAPSGDQPQVGPSAEILSDSASDAVSASLRTGLGDTPWMMLLLVIPLCIAVGRYVLLEGVGRLGLNQIITVMLILGLLLQGSLGAYTRSATAGASACLGIMLQFPLYAGIMAMMLVSGLAGQVAEVLVALGEGNSVAVLSFVSAALTNLAVPSGGGQWAIQGPIVLKAGLTEGISAGKMVMSVAYGDQLTNMLQPFWALPLLSITKVNASDIVGYTFLLMCIAAAWIGLGLAVI